LFRREEANFFALVRKREERIWNGADGKRSMKLMERLEHRNEERAVWSEQLHSQFMMFREVIISVLHHPNRPEKQEIMDEIDRDLDEKYRQAEISLQEKLSLKMLLEAGYLGS